MIKVSTLIKMLEFPIMFGIITYSDNVEFHILWLDILAPSNECRYDGIALGRLETVSTILCEGEV